MNIEKIEKTLAIEPKYRLAQAKKVIFGDLIDDWSKATTLPKDLIVKLEEVCPLKIEAEIFESKDKNTVKALIKLADDLKIETVLMRHNDRNTICVSSQVGCPMGCAFCATGTMGLKRNLTMGEIIAQVLLFARLLKKTEEKITNIVFMGMGEPFLNYDKVMGAIKYLHAPDTMNIGARRFSISTCGILDGIKKFTKEEMEINLAISLHAPTDELRSSIMPINRQNPLKKLIIAIKNYLEETHRKVMIEYTMIKGVNDSAQNAEELAELLQNMLVVVNLIPYNDTDLFQTSDAAAINRFKTILGRNKISVVQRHKFGDDIEAACGQLAAKSRKK